ncbi:DEAD/DEAH box helicase family protein [Clostridium cochlearium]|uniref:DEAD/DEAH box helicase family protein n=1 Tax=Clostridium cochlearium TaxID=1494 RepID=UPI000B94D985|nr:DEAD/DEAH box helicase family protein [Clostridium cochlearium]MCG4572222.1 DEAD/DEAH box helicase family protein [Clostridium cochlearium]MCR1971898.1 DEAD/DEAH box helicase family protein [Clostridium cochlearium]NMA58132.1 DEAD/DEAH box helicase family protein [Clostridium cochlearium]NME95225.1 DEAD/DEAH box helicase family protein [Clostridium cochlearium]SNV69655.1 DNA/RNA helicase [Clostridium cochlearium]
MTIKNKSIEEEVVKGNLANKEIETSTNCITGDSDHLLDKLRKAFKKAKKIDIIVAFLMESGVRLLEKDLKDVLNRNVPIRILTGNYLNITQPQALYLLKDILKDKVDLRFYNVSGKSFHPKAYIFEYDNKDGDIFIGSSNISKSALTSGIEWNYRIRKENNELDFQCYKDTFENLFNNKSIIVDDNELDRYSKNWRKPKLFFDIDNKEKTEEKIISYPKPKDAQIEALYKLKKFREEGFDRGIVVAATGIGKTYLAAFDSSEYNKVLFVAHRQEILNQAETSFRIVRKTNNTGFFSGNRKDRNKDVLFATVQTLGQKQYLCDDYFKDDEFDYIIIDEFHHAVADNYQNILDYFKPKFLLGLTATPERMDNRDVFEICNHDVVYEVRLKEAINKGWLTPFRYYGIYDDVDYNNISFKNGKYDDKELEEALMINKRGDLILKHYNKYNSKRALGFCSSRNHANYMAKYFSEKGIPSCAVLSGEKLEYCIEREEALKKFNSGEIKVIFSVDMFNEGLDVPLVDMVMFLRPTQSSTIFLQQLGRGLRKHKDKKYVNVLDFIGNYKKANLIPFLLTGDIKNIGEKSKKNIIPPEENFPEDCSIDFDFRLVDIFKKMREEQKKIIDLVIEEYYRIKHELKRRPTRLDMYKYIDDNIYNNIRTKRKLNIFNDYLGFLNKLEELNEEENKFIETKAHDFIVKIETTAMTKTYKMPLLLAFYNNGDFKLKVSEEEIYLSFKEFYKKPSNAVDLIRDKNGENYKEWGREEYLKVAKNPRNAFINTAKEFFIDKGETYEITDELEDYVNNKYFISHFKDVIDYKTSKFYKERLEKREELNKQT